MLGAVLVMARSGELQRLAIEVEQCLAVRPARCRRRSKELLSFFEGGHFFVHTAQADVQREARLALLG